MGSTIAAWGVLVAVWIFAGHQGGILSVNAASPEINPSSPAAPRGASGAVREASADSTRAARVIRGWEIESVRAIKRPTIVQVTPEYEGRRPSAERKRAVAARKGGFFIIQVQCKWATLQPPNEPLWVGRPEVVLVDDEGREYPAVDALTRRGGEYVTAGMVSPSARRDARTERSRSYRLLAYFDLPNNPRNLSLRFPGGGPEIPVEQLGNLPDALVDLPD